jgi:hypothetical protein
MPSRSASGDSVSVREFIDLFARDESAITFIPIGPGRAGYPVDAKLRDYYRRGIDQWYLWNGNNVVSRGHGNLLVVALGAVSTSLGEFAAVLSGDYPGVVPKLTSTNASLVEKMIRVRTLLLVISLALGALALAIVVQVIALVRMSRRSASVRAEAVSLGTPTRR